MDKRRQTIKQRPGTHFRHSRRRAVRIATEPLESRPLLSGGFPGPATFSPAGFTHTIELTGLDEDTNADAVISPSERAAISGGMFHFNGTVVGPLALFHGNVEIDVIDGTVAANGSNVLGSTTTLNVPAMSDTGTFTIAVPVTSLPLGTDNLHLRVVGGPTPQTSQSIDLYDFTLTITPSLDLTVTKSDSPDPVTVGQQLTYTLTVNNTGLDSAAGVSLVDTLPQGVTFASSSVNGVTPVNGVLTFDLATIAGGGSSQVTVTVVPNVTGTITNQASVSTTTSEPDTSNNSASQDTTVSPAQSDLEVTLADSPDPVTVGSNLVYTLTAKNNGTDDAPGVMVTQMLPANVTFVSTSVGNVTPVSGVLTFDLGTLASGASTPITVTVTPTAAGNLSSSASISSAVVNDTTSGNDNASAMTSAVLPQVDLAVAITDQPDPVRVGQTLVYTVTVTNNGPDDASNITLSTHLAPNLTFQSASLPSTGPDINGVLTTDLGTITSGSSKQVTIQVVPNQVGSSTTWADIAATGVNDTDSSNDSSSADTTVTPKSATLAIAQSTSSPAVVGQNLTYTVTITNNGPDAATNVAVTDTLPAGVTFVSASNSSTPQNGVLTFALGSIPANGSKTFTFIVTPNQAGTLTNTASANATEATMAVEDQNMVDVQAAPVQSADLEVKQTPSTSTPTVGQNLVYTITVTNHGPDTATDVVVMNPVPTGADFVAADSSQGTVSGQGNTVVFHVGSLAANQSATLTLVVSPTGTSPITNSVTVSSAQTDPTSSNDTSSTSVTPQQSTAGPVLTQVQRFGYHAMPTTLVLTFDHALNATSANDANNYAIVDPGRDGRVGTADDRVIPVSSAVYNDANHTVTLAPTSRLYLFGQHVLAIRGGEGGLTDSDGNAIESQSTMTAFGPESLVLSPPLSQSRVLERFMERQSVRTRQLAATLPSGPQAFAQAFNHQATTTGATARAELDRLMAGLALYQPGSQRTRHHHRPGGF